MVIQKSLIRIEEVVKESSAIEKGDVLTGVSEGLEAHLKRMKC